MKVKISCDDATIDDIKLADLLAKYDLIDNTVFFWPVMPAICNEVKGRISLNEDQMQDIAKSFRVGSHTLTHQLLTRTPLDIAQREIIESRDLLQKKFKQPIDDFAYPRGYSNPDLQKTVQDAGYSRARSTLVGYIHESENPYFEQNTVHAGVNRKEYAGLDWFTYARNMLALAEQTPNSVYSVFLHSWELTKYGAWHNFGLLLKELREPVT